MARATERGRTDLVGCAHVLPADATLADAGEFALIDRADRRSSRRGSRCWSVPATTRRCCASANGHVVVSTDMVVEGRHFRRDWVVRRATSATGPPPQNLSDINAMGGRAHSLTIGLAAPRRPAGRSGRWTSRDGFADECALVGASVVGGDLTRSDQVVIAVTVLGACTQTPVLRSGAKPGDVLALTGRQGWSAGGLAVLGRGFRSPRVLVEAYRRPEPPYDAGPVAAEAGATSMIDVSDGLLADAGHLAEESGVAIDVRRDALEVPSRCTPSARRSGVDPMQFILAGGDDHALLATFPDGRRPGRLDRHRCGRRAATGVTVDGAAYDGPTGWTHF